VLPPSKDDFRSQLHIERLTRPNARRSPKVADGAEELTKASAKSSGRRAEISTVKDVERFGSQLDAKTISDRRGFEGGSVDVNKAGTVQLIASHRAERAARRRRKRSGIDPLLGRAAGRGSREELVADPRERITYKVDALGILVRSARIGGIKNG